MAFCMLVKDFAKLYTQTHVHLLGVPRLGHEPWERVTLTVTAPTHPEGLYPSRRPKTQAHIPVPRGAT